MKTSTFIVIFLLGLFSPSLTKVRTDYKKSFNSKEVTLQLNKYLAEVKKTDKKLLVAYKGAVLILMANYSKVIKEKKTFFKEGATLLNFAIIEEPTNVEMRCLRLSIQENAPKLLKYRANKIEDKQKIPILWFHRILFFTLFSKIRLIKNIIRNVMKHQLL